MAELEDTPKGCLPLEQWAAAILGDEATSAASLEEMLTDAANESLGGRIKLSPQEVTGKKTVEVCTNQLT